MLPFCKPALQVRGSWNGYLYDANKDSCDGDDLFDAAWAMSCLAGLYERLNEPFLAEHAYRKSITIFAGSGRPLNASVICEALAEFLAAQGRNADAESLLKEAIVYLKKYWNADNHHVLSAEEQLKHFQLTGKIIKACNHEWCEPCNVDRYNLGFEEYQERAGGDEHSKPLTF